MMEDITIHNIDIHSTDYPISVRLENRGRKHIPEVPDCPIENITGTTIRNYYSSITGIQGKKIENIILRGCKKNNLTICRKNRDLILGPTTRSIPTGM